MPSPFPGMDPYVESSGRWGDFHGSLIGVFRQELNARLPRGYAADIDLNVWLHEAVNGGRQMKPDVYVAEAARRGRSEARRRRLSAQAPMTITLPKLERRQQKYIRIVDLESNQVVTAIEVLSPTNKRAGSDRDAYLLKREEYLAARVNLVELDLSRGNRRLPLGRPRLEASDYYLMICCAWRFPHADVWNFTIRDPFPPLTVPLAEDVDDVMLPLRSCVDQVYDGGRYRDRLPYDRHLSPRPRNDDVAWVRDVLARRSSA